MSAKINATSHLHTRGHGRTKLFQNPDGRETTLATRMTTKTLLKQTSFAV